VGRDTFSGLGKVSEVGQPLVFVSNFDKGWNQSRRPPLFVGHGVHTNSM
jgi:hypothetical protein